MAFKLKNKVLFNTRHYLVVSIPGRPLRKLYLDNGVEVYVEQHTDKEHKTLTENISDSNVESHILYKHNRVKLIQFFIEQKAKNKH